MDKETSTLQDAFKPQMAEVNCTNPSTPGDLWYQILHIWRSPDSGLVKASHLFPRRQARFMNSIFGDGASRDLFLPCNGLFLHPAIEKALHSGYIAIIPDMGLNDWFQWWDIANLSQMEVPRGEHYVR
ncbi:unnamed protein product [Fusarium venenatum]|uniref:HNH nuclease domain-containing protein n=1 Tax=Fusarium venenatum TaxID=56646 RepID=A0A2L2SZA7_9HYPO|nr:uncharacterized protein FVRRES_04729 [Fusarium venenatum]CEI60293.1 unnamed protein product [Fusarium venenatum]